MFIHKKTVVFIPYFDSPFCLINYWQNGGFFLKSEIPVCVLIKNFGTPAHHESNKNAVCRFSTPLPEKSELKIRHHSSVLFYPQNRLYPTIISAAAVITRKKVVGNIKAQVIPKPTQNSMRPHNRFISILPKQDRESK